MSLWGLQTAPSTTCHTPTVSRRAEIKHRLCQTPSQTGGRTSPNVFATGAFPSSDPVTAGMTQCGRRVRSTAVVPTHPCEAQSWDTPKPLASLASIVSPTPRAKTVHQEAR